MKNITITIDLKSLCLGAVGVVSIGLLSNFSNADQPRPNAADEVRRYQVVTTERSLIIVDTKTGQYIIDRPAIGRPSWMKGDFTTTHNSSKSDINR